MITPGGAHYSNGDRRHLEGDSLSDEDDEDLGVRAARITFRGREVQQSRPNRNHWERCQVQVAVGNIGRVCWSMSLLVSMLAVSVPAGALIVAGDSQT